MVQLKISIFLACILVGISACTYWVAAPSIIAAKFVRTIADEDFAAADEMFVHPKDAFLLPRFDHEDSWTFQARAKIQSITVSQLISGTRDISVELVYGKPGRLQDREWKMKALHGGIGTPEQEWTMVGGMVIAAQ